MTTLKNKNLKEELIEAYKNMGKSDLQLLKEWDKFTMLNPSFEFLKNEPDIYTKSDITEDC